jgi:hypothetical protein
MMMGLDTQPIHTYYDDVQYNDNQVNCTTLSCYTIGRIAKYIVRHWQRSLSFLIVEAMSMRTFTCLVLWA